MCFKLGQKEIAQSSPHFPVPIYILFEDLVLYLYGRDNISIRVIVSCAHNNGVLYIISQREWPFVRAGGKSRENIDYAYLIAGYRWRVATNKMEIKTHASGAQF